MRWRRDHGLRLLGRRLAALLGVDRLEHVSDLASLRCRNVAEDVPGEMYDAALPPGCRQVLGGALDETAAGIGDDELHALEPTVDEVAEEGRPAGAVLLRALADAEDLAITLGIHADRHQQRDVAHLAPAQLRFMMMPSRKT
jgi:hypothetical protein